MSEAARPSTRRITISDVAKRAGVGKVTVSYVLNGHSSAARISEETAKRVHLAAEELNYRPNALARMLVQRRADAIAVVFQYASFFSSLSGFTSEAMRGVCSACVDCDVDLMLHTKKAVDAECEASNLMDGRVDGVLLLRDRGDETMLKILESRFPLVMFFTREYERDVPFVDTDNYAGGKLATEHLLSLGHRSIAMVAGPTKSVAAKDRYLGYCDALAEAGVKIEGDLIVRTDDHSTSREKLRALMQTAARPTAVFAWSDDDALDSMRMLLEHGFSIPGDVSIVGYDSSENCDLVVPALTSVRQPVYDMAYDATRLLVQLVRGETPSSTQIVYPPELVIRSSTGPVRAAIISQ